MDFPSTFNKQHDLQILNLCSTADAPLYIVCDILKVRQDLAVDSQKQEVPLWGTYKAVTVTSESGKSVIGKSPWLYMVLQ